MSLIQKLKDSGFAFKKSLGQNFIVDEGYLHSIVKELNLSKDDVVIEVGTGAGTLTRVLSQYVKQVITYEVDKRLEPILAQQFAGIKNIELRFEDALQANIKQEKFALVANIPYYITTPLIVKFINHPNCTSIAVLVQKELAHRIVAKPGSKDYGALSVGIQTRASARIIKEVSRRTFVPAPNVDSALVLIEKSGTSELGKDFDTFLKNVFSQRRKKLSNSVPNIQPQFKDLRPEQLTVQQFVEVWQNLFDKKNNKT